MLYLKIQRDTIAFVITMKNVINISITSRIDNIFNEICNVFNNFISDKINFKFFLRRTLGGCEFGICLDCDFEIDLDLLEDKNYKNTQRIKTLNIISVLKQLSD